MCRKSRFVLWLLPCLLRGSSHEGASMYTIQPFICPYIKHNIEYDIVNILGTSFILLRLMCVDDDQTCLFYYYHTINFFSHMLITSPAASILFSTICICLLQSLSQKYIIYQEDTHKWRIRKGWQNGQAISVERKPIHPNKPAIPCT